MRKKAPSPKGASCRSAADLKPDLVKKTVFIQYKAPGAQAYQTPEGLATQLPSALALATPLV
jgi:hypothetical protein